MLRRVPSAERVPFMKPDGEGQGQGQGAGQGPAITGSFEDLDALPGTGSDCEMDLDDDDEHTAPYLCPCFGCMGWLFLMRARSPRDPLSPPVAPLHRTPPFQHTLFIQGHYRVRHGVVDAILSTFSLHNETLNIWTHAMGAILFSCLLVNTVWFDELLRADATALLCMVIFHVGTIGMCLCSVLFHTFNCVSEAWYRRTLQLDGVGVILAIATGHVIPFQLGLLCDPVQQMLHTVAFSVLTACAVLCLLLPTFHTIPFRPFRALIFGTLLFYWLFAFAVTSLINAAVTPSSSLLPLPFLTTRQQGPFITLAAGVFWYLVGGVLLVFRIPERYFPGKLDLSLWSHPLWHSFGLLGSFLFYRGYHAFLVWETTHPCPS